MPDKQDVLTCRNWRAGTCPKSDAIVLQEDSQYIQLGCRTCRGGWVVTMPEGRAKARYENKIKEMKEAEARDRARREQPVYFT